MLLKHARHLHGKAAGTCPYRSMARLRCARLRRDWVSARAASALAVPDTDPSSAEHIVVPPVTTTPVTSHILLASQFAHIKELFAAHRTTLTPADLTVAWVRLAKVCKEPSERLSPDVQKFVDILACASIDRMPHFTPAHLCSLIWGASTLKRDVAQSGMFRTFLKSWASELEPQLPQLSLDQLRKCMAAVTRVGFAPGHSWRLALESALTARLNDAGGEGACTCPRTLASVLVSAAGLGCGPHPSHAFREAVAAACAAAFAEGRRGTGRPVGAARRLGGADGGGGSGGSGGRAACSALWVAAVLGVPLGPQTVQAMLSHVTAGNTGAPVTHGSSQCGDPNCTDTDPAYCASQHLQTPAPSPPNGSDLGRRSGRGKASSSTGGGDSRDGGSQNVSTTGLGAFTPLDFAQVIWALAKLRYRPGAGEAAALLSASAPHLGTAPPELLATMMWGLAELEVVPPGPWLDAAYTSFERRLESAAAEPLQALLHSAATLQLPAPGWAGRLMDRLQVVDLAPLPDASVVDLVMCLHALGLHPPPPLAHRLQSECVQRLAARGGGGGGGGAEGGAGQGPVL